MASNEFIKALGKRKNIQERLKNAKNAERNSYALPDIPDGNYFARVKLIGKVNPKNGVPLLEIKWTIVDDSEWNGKGSTDTYWLQNDDPEREEKTWDILGKALKTLTGENDLELEEVGDLAAYIDSINDSNIVAEISLKRWKSAKGKEGFNVFYNGIYDNADDDSADDDDTADDDPTVDAEIVKGNVVEYDGEEWVVVTSNERDQTCSLKSTDDPKKKVTDIAWSDVEYLAATAN